MRINTLLSALSLVVVVSAASADTVVGYSSAGSAYTQLFNGLPNTGTSATWSNSSGFPTVQGWNAYQRGATGTANIRDTTGTGVSALQIGAGAGNTGGLYSFGSAGSTDRALGTLNGSNGDTAVTFAIQNTTGATLTSFTFSWILEQWRDGGNATPVAQNLVVDYKVTNVTSTNSLSEGISFLTDAAYVTGFTTLRTVASPTFTAVAGALDGNAAANRVSLTDTVSGINWANNTVLVIRFWDDNHSGNDHGFGIDDVSFTAVPTPGAIALLGLGLFTAHRRRR
jgi:MYXO-CTERM domain-containing protein